MRVVRGGADELGQDRPGSIVLTLADALGISLQSLMDDADLVGGTRGYAVIEAVGSAIEDLSSTVPVLVVVEDLQWADELSVQGLASLVRRIGPLPVALVVTRRPTPRPALVERIFTGQPLEIEHLHLPGLDDAAVTAMVATLTGVPPGRNLSRRVAGASGNPLYVTELIRALDDNGEIGVHGGLAEVDDPALPASLRATVLGRLAALSERSVEMLRLASLLGRAFTLTDLATISGRRVVDVATDLRSIVDAAILTGESDTLSFRHDLIRDSVYDDILPAIRVDLHAAAGRALAAAGAPTVQVARQMELGARPGDLVAVEWLVRAGAESLSFDYAGAITMFQQALSVAGDRWPGRTGVEAAQLEPLALCGRVDEARSIAHALLDRGVERAGRVRRPTGAGRRGRGVGRSRRRGQRDEDGSRAARRAGRRGHRADLPGSEPRAAHRTSGRRGAPRRRADARLRRVLHQRLRRCRLRGSPHPRPDRRRRRPLRAGDRARSSVPATAVRQRVAHSRIPHPRPVDRDLPHAR